MSGHGTLAASPSGDFSPVTGRVSAEVAGVQVGFDVLGLDAFPRAALAVDGAQEGSQESLFIELCARDHFAHGFAKGEAQGALQVLNDGSDFHFRHALFSQSLGSVRG